MTDPDAAQRAREWLERQLADLGQLRNATRRDQTFKTWRQQTLTVIQRVWPGETRRVDRFRRIPFSPPAPHATEAQVRESYERGWGEAGVLLRDFLAEINLLGLPQVRAAGTYAGSETEAAMGPMPALGGQAGPRPVLAMPPADAGRPAAMPPKDGGRPAVTQPADAARPTETPPADAGRPAVTQPKDDGFGDDIGRAMDRLLGRSPASRGPASTPRPAPADAAPEPDSPAAELVRLAGELEALGLSPTRAASARAALLALARAARSEVPPWELVGEVLGHAGATPELARRVLPLLLEFIATAA
jgi:hypothetical protein